MQLQKELFVKQLVFLAKFFTIFFSLHTLLYFANLDFFQEFLAFLVAGFLGLTVKGTQIVIGSQTFVVDKSCTGLISAFILAGVVFSLRKPEMKTKIAMLLAGTFILLLANIPRLYFVLLAGKLFGVQTAEFLHTLSWLAMSAIILFFWHHATLRLTGIKNFEGFL